MRDLMTGAALGAFVGLLVGLATTGVVGSIVGALVALMTSFFGLQGSNGPLGGAAPMRILGFSGAAAAALLVGLYLRAADVLAPSPAQRGQVWQQAGFSKKDAAELVAIEQLGVVRGDWRAPDAVIAAARERSTRGSTALFATDAAGACETLQGRDYPTAAALAEAMTAESESWREFVTSLPAGLPEDERRSLLQAAMLLVCG